jgi:hypothetical protein
MTRFGWLKNIENNFKINFAQIAVVALIVSVYYLVKRPVCSNVSLDWSWIRKVNSLCVN